ncbi:ankyrin repeat domain-containing protein [uncultured Thiohalocapsa sp.]|uniref:ankyrin repeat domain-containing protein n=1 Tax=uncultured Thiohalocapsa sp. TaxID=768990 RepID=UPI0025CD1E16|nr:ankyrin repeat domain-containing protein [uncultured Thiohalocapsa sp.]
MQSLLRLGTLLGCLLLLQGCDAPPKPSGNFHHAVQSADLVQVKRHLYWGTDPNQRGPGGQPPLNIAVRDGKVAIAKELLKHGADPMATGPDGDTALMTALAHGRVQAAELLLQRGAKDDLQPLLYPLVQRGALDRDTLDLLLARGVALDGVGADGQTPLALAVQNGNVNIAKLLLERGAPLGPAGAPDEDAPRPRVPTADDIDDPIMAQLLRRFGVIE